MISDNSKIKIAFEQLSRFEKDEAEKLAIADGAGDHIALIRKALADMKYRASRSSRTPRDVSDSLSVGGDVSPELVADEILYNCYLVTASDDETYYLYDHGVYLKVPRLEIEKKCRDLIQGKFTSHKRNEIHTQLKSKTSTNRRDFDSHPDIINLENGLYNLSDGALRDHRPDIISTIRVPVRYDPSAACPLIEKFLREILPSEEDRLTVLEFFGYCLIPGQSLQKAFMMVGDGANGKSTLLELLRAFLGPSNVSGQSVQDLNTNRFAAFQLKGKLANICADLPPTSMGSTGKFKLLTGGDTFDVEEKFKNAVSITNSAKLIFSANTVPPSSDVTRAFFRRWEFFNFPNTFTGEKCDKELLKKLITPVELAGLLNLALKGIERIKTRGDFTKTCTYEDIADQYNRLSNPILAFVGECLMQDDEATATKDDVYAAYRVYCNRRGLPVQLKNGFTLRLSAACEFIRPLGKTEWSGARIR